jgi:hypothetical protein
MPPSSTVKKRANEFISEQIAQDKLPKDSRIGKSSRYYLTKVKYSGIKQVERFGNTSVGRKGSRNFGWVLLEFGSYGVGGRGGIISLTNKSKTLTGDPVLFGAYIKRWDVETNVEVYAPLTKYENIEIEKTTNNTLVLRDGMNKDRWTITRGSKEDDFYELIDYIASKKMEQAK